MFTNLWAKYLPILRIVLKRSLASEQMLALNVPDFERAGLRSKAGYKFLVKLREGKLSNVIVDSPLAASLIAALLSDKAVKDLLSSNEFHISMNSKFQLTIKHIQKFEVLNEEMVNENQG